MVLPIFNHPVVVAFDVIDAMVGGVLSIRNILLLSRLLVPGNV